MEVERDHVLGRKNTNEDGDIFALEDDLLAKANQTEGASDELEAKFEALGSDASFDRVVFDGGDYGTGGDQASDEELDFLGLPGLLEPDQVRELLHKRQAEVDRRAEAVAARDVRSGGPDADRAGDPRAGRPTAPRAERSGRRLAPPHRPAARRHPQRPPPQARRARRRARLLDPAEGAHRAHPRLGHPTPSLTHARRTPRPGPPGRGVSVGGEVLTCCDRCCKLRIPALQEIARLTQFL